jgi:hypothetical protein
MGRGKNKVMFTEEGFSYGIKKLGVGQTFSNNCSIGIVAKEQNVILHRKLMLGFTKKSFCIGNPTRKLLKVFIRSPCSSMIKVERHY